MVRRPQIDLGLSTRDYIQYRLTTIENSIAMAQRSLEDNKTATAKATFARLISEMEASRNEMRYALHYADTHEVHPDLGPTWLPQMVGHDRN